MTSTGAVLHLSIPVHDLEAARRFYVDVLGCEPGRVRDGWIDVWFFGMQLTLQCRPDEVRAPEEQGVRHFGVALSDEDDFRAPVRRVAAHDVAWLSPPVLHEAAALSGKLADPSGNVIELKYYDDPDRYRPTPAR